MEILRVMQGVVCVSSTPSNVNPPPLTPPRLVPGLLLHLEQPLNGFFCIILDLSCLPLIEFIYGKRSLKVQP